MKIFQNSQGSRIRAISKVSIAVVVVGLIFLAVATFLYVSPLTSAQTSATTSTSLDNGSVLSQATTSFGDPNGTAVNVVIQYGNGYPEGSAFNPQVITVVIGVNNTVVWTNQDSFVHDIFTSSGLAAGPASGDLAPGDSYTFTFTVAGTYSYYCAYHPWMTGEVIVENP